MAKGPKLPEISVTARQREILKRIGRTRSSDVGLVRRTKIILGGADGMSNSAIVEQYQIGHQAVRTWRGRWQAAHPRLQWIESSDAHKDEAERMQALEAAMRAVFRDEQRPGTPATFSAEQQVKIIAVACEDPHESGRPISHWTPRELADEVMKRQIVASISVRSVGRFLKGGAVQAAPESVLAQQQTRGRSSPGRVQRTGRNGVCRVCSDTRITDRGSARDEYG